MPANWIRFPLIYFLITAAAGVIMRSMALFPIPVIEYENMLHAHSHLALLGWGYMALFLLFMVHFVKENKHASKQMKWMFWLNQVTVAGMFVAFTLQGYALFSIAFSTLQILLSYWFAIFFWRYLNREQAAKAQTGEGNKQELSFIVAKGSLVALLVSSMGPWTLAWLSANEMKDSPLYDTAIYFYLHFQYNGWFALGLLAILLRVLENKGFCYSIRLFKLHYQLYIWTLLPAFLLSVLWIPMNGFWHVIAGSAGVIQWFAVVVLGVVLYRMREALTQVFQGWSGYLLLFSVGMLLIKATLELGVIVPDLAEMIYDSRSVVIGYLHLALLGYVSIFCLSLFVQQGWISGRGKSANVAFVMFLIAYAMNELILFLQGLCDWIGAGYVAYQEQWLWTASAGMLTAITIITVKSKAGRASKG